MSSSTSSSSSRGFSHPGPPKGQPAFVVDDWSDVAEFINSRFTDSYDGERIHSRILPKLDLPGFGEPEDTCGEYVPQAMRFCTECGDVKQVKHNCLRYDCPQHAPYAVRRRAAGSSSGSGAAPKLDALRRYLHAFRSKGESDDYLEKYHHIVISPGERHVTREGVGDPLEAGKEAVARILEKLGLQGFVMFHPWSGDHEDPLQDDRGKWRTRLFHGRDWSGDVREELKYRPHFHVIAVGPHVDLENIGELYDSTGWVVARILTKGSNISIPHDAAMARALTYGLSHSGIYETAEQRRLAAWFKGPDVNRVRVLEDKKERMAAIVNAAGEDVLGIASPSPYCDVDSTPHELPSVLRAQAGPFESEPLGGYGGPSIQPKGPRDLGDVYAGASSSSTSWSSSTSTGSSGLIRPSLSSGGSGNKALSPEQRAESLDARECGGYCRHISKANKYLLNAEKRRQLVYVDDLEAAYRSYVDVMTAAGRDPDQDPRAELPEELEGRPPPD